MGLGDARLRMLPYVDMHYLLHPRLLRYERRHAQHTAGTRRAKS